MTALERAPPAERLASVLHEVFAVPLDEIGAIVGGSPGAAELVVARARRRVLAARPVPDAGNRRQGLK